MNIIKYELLSEIETLTRLKKTRLKGFGQPEIYRDATLRIVESIDTNLIVPPQRYVLKSGVQTVLDLYKTFARLGVDIFALRGALLFWTEEMNPESDLPIPFLPALIEESFERDDRRIFLLNDGMHRVYAARMLGHKPNVVWVTNIPREYPYYAYPLASGWEDVREIVELTEGYKKKEYRNPDDYKALFREFNDIFPGVQKQRTKIHPIELKT